MINIRCNKWPNTIIGINGKVRQEYLAQRTHTLTKNNICILYEIVIDIIGLAGIENRVSKVEVE